MLKIKITKEMRERCASSMRRLRGEPEPQPRRDLVRRLHTGKTGHVDLDRNSATGELETWFIPIDSSKKRRWI